MKSSVVAALSWASFPSRYGFDVDQIADADALCEQLGISACERPYHGLIVYR